MIARILARVTGASQDAVRRALAELPGPEAPITAQDVAWAYRLFLDRVPENEAVVRAKLTDWRTTDQLRTEFLVSTEFRLRNPHLFTDTSTVVIKELEGGRRIFVDLSDQLVAAAILRGRYEVVDTEFVRRTVRSGQRALDLGANIGFFTLLLASAVGPTGRVFAFEPNAHIAGLLERSIAENRLRDRVVLRAAAVGERAGTAPLMMQRSPLNSGASYLDLTGEGPPPIHVAEDVPVVALDECDFGGPVGFVKIDVQGAEALALRGGARMLARDRPVILSEIAPGPLSRVSGCTPAAYVAEVERLGYECRLLGADGPGPRYVPGEHPGLVSVVFLPTGGGAARAD